MENALKDALGQDPMFGAKRVPSGIKYAVTATTISDATLCLISNYNGEGPYEINSSEFAIFGCVSG